LASDKSKEKKRKRLTKERVMGKNWGDIKTEGGGKKKTNDIFRKRIRLGGLPGGKRKTRHKRKG